MNMKKEVSTVKQKPFFHPTFGSRPAQIVGRDQIIEQFLEGLYEPIGSRNRCTFLIGQRGMGKTALLLELADLARENDMIPAVVTAYKGMNEEIIETIQRNAAQILTKNGRQVQGFEVGAFGFSFGLTLSGANAGQAGFRPKHALLCDEMEKYNKGILLLVDETTNSDEVRQLGITYQHMIGENKNIAIVMAGLPQAVSSVLNDKVLTFLNRAEKVNLGPISLAEIKAYYVLAFRKEEIQISEDLLNEAVAATEGYPYLMQLIGYYLLRFAGTEKTVKPITVRRAIEAARHDMEENVFTPLLAPLSDTDLLFLKAMAVDGRRGSQMADIGARTGKNNSYLQPYRARLISAGIIEAPKKGKVCFTMPYLAEYLQKEVDEAFD